jgi:hypothetical protein
VEWGRWACLSLSLSVFSRDSFSSGSVPGALFSFGIRKPQMTLLPLLSLPRTGTGSGLGFLGAYVQGHLYVSGWFSFRNGVQSAAH